MGWVIFLNHREILLLSQGKRQFLEEYIDIETLRALTKMKFPPNILMRNKSNPLLPHRSQGVSNWIISSQLPALSANNWIQATHYS